MAPAARPIPCTGARTLRAFSHELFPRSAEDTRISGPPEERNQCWYRWVGSPCRPSVTPLKREIAPKILQLLTRIVLQAPLSALSGRLLSRHPVLGWNAMRSHSVLLASNLAAVCAMDPPNKYREAVIECDRIPFRNVEPGPTLHRKMPTGKARRAALELWQPTSHKRRCPVEPYRTIPNHTELGEGTAPKRLGLANHLPPAGRKSPRNPKVFCVPARKY